MSRSHIRQTVRNILAELGMVTAPTSVEKVAKGLGISIRYAPLEDELSGMAFIKENTKVIVVNALHHPHRQRFTIAHEIGHHVLHADELATGVHVDKVIMRRDVISASGTDDQEIQSNVFASELLMPKHLVISLCGTSFDFNDEAALKAWAKQFKVSVTALQYRLTCIDD